MTQYNRLNVKLSNSQLNKLKSAIKNETEVIRGISPNMIGDSNDETHFTAAASAADAEIHKKILGSGNTTLIISNKDIEDLIEIVKSLEDSGLLLKGVTESVQNEVKEQKGGFRSMLLGTLGASLLRNLLSGKGINKKMQTNT